MNRYLVLITAVISFAFINTTIARAAEDAPEQEQKSIVQDPQRPTRPTGLRPPKRTDMERMDARQRGRGRDSGRGRGGGRMNREIMQEQQLAILGKQYKEKLREHEAFIGRLNRILKSAQDEKAPETVKLLEKLIEKRKHTFTESTKNLMKRRDAIRKQLTGTKGQEKTTNMNRDQQPTPVKDVTTKRTMIEKLMKQKKGKQPIAEKVKKTKKPVVEKVVPAAEDESKDGKKKGFWKKLFGK